MTVLLCTILIICFSNKQTSGTSVGNDLNQPIYKSRFKSLCVTYDLDLNQF